MSHLPVGTFDGTVHGPLRFLVNTLWTGKTFTGSTVVNHIGRRKMVEGTVRREGETVIIDYPQLGLRDHLTDLWEGERWSGTMQLWRWTVRFTLTRAQERR